MGIVQEYLFLNDSYKVVQTQEYLGALVNHIFLSYGPNDGSIQVNSNIIEALLSVDKAIPCGLILNELMINSFKPLFQKIVRENYGIVSKIGLRVFYFRNRG